MKKKGKVNMKFQISLKYFEINRIESRFLKFFYKSFNKDNFHDELTMYIN